VLCQELDMARVPGMPSIIGMISALVADAVPVRVEQMVAAFRLVGEPDEHATISLVLQDESGADVKGHPLSLRLAQTGICDGHISLAPVEIPSFGKYSVALRVDGIDAFRTTFWVVEQ
jgi:hypothetical protein